MEITFSKSKLIGAAALLLAAAILLLAFRAGLFDPLWQPQTAVNAEAYNAQPAMQALSVLYAPSSERSAWEETACANMTVEGCALFKAYYALPIWQSAVAGSDTKFIAVKQTLEDGSQVWQAETTISGKQQPLYIHVQQREDGQWLLARVLFEEEAQKYEK